MTRLTTECVINLGFVGLLPGLVLFFCHMQSYLFKEVCKAKKYKLIISLKILKEFVCDVDSPKQNLKNQLQSQSLSATGGVENITEGLSGLTLVSFFKVL